MTPPWDPRLYSLIWTFQGAGTYINYVSSVRNLPVVTGDIAAAVIQNTAIREQYVDRCGVAARAAAGPRYLLPT